MPANLPQLTKDNSISCLQMINVWASALKPGEEQDRILAALKNLAKAMGVQDKLEPGTRFAPEKPSGTRTAPDLVDPWNSPSQDEDQEEQKERDKLEHGTRAEKDKLERGTRAEKDKLDHGTRAAKDKPE